MMMGIRCCVYALMVTLLWLALASRPAAAETRIEVDENGDEYELKRFFIQGRQLNGSGSQSQCVVTRRKRASRALQAQPQAGLTVTSQTLGVSGPEHREAIAEQPQLQQLQSGKRRYVALTALHLDGQLLTQAQVDDDDDEEEEAEEGDDDEEEEGVDEDDEEEEEEEEVEQEQAQQLQLVDATQQQKQLSQSPSLVAATFAVPLAQATPVNVVSTAAHLPQGVSVVANAATHANVGGDAGIVVVQSELPPKVNPSTHAVFELKPLRQQQQQQQQQQLPAQSSPAFAFWPQQLTDDGEQDEQEEDEDEDAEDYFYYGPGGATGPNRYQDLAVFDEHEHIISEESPVSTTAIWSTSPDEEMRPVNQKKKQQQQIKRNKKKQQQIKRNKKKQQQQQQEQDLEQEQEQELIVKPNKEQKQKRKQQQSLSSDGDRKKPAKKPSSSSSSASSSSSSSNKRKRPSSSSSSNKRKSKPSKRQKKKKSKPSSSSNSGSSNSVANKRRRKPSSAASSSSSSSGSSSSGSSMGGYRRRRPQQSQQSQQSQQQKRRRQQQQQQKRRRQQQQQRRRRNKNRQNGNRGGNGGGNGGGNRRQQWDNEPIINCIYINKDPPTTTQRPFWNILGRDAEAGPEQEQQQDVAADAVDAVQVPQHDVASEQALRQAMRRSSGDFGHRKRATLRFAA